MGCVSGPRPCHETAWGVLCRGQSSPPPPLRLRNLRQASPPRPRCSCYCRRRRFGKPTAAARRFLTAGEAGAAAGMVPSLPHLLPPPSHHPPPLPHPRPAAAIGCCLIGGWRAHPAETPPSPRPHPRPRQGPACGRNHRHQMAWRQCRQGCYCQHPGAQRFGSGSGAGSVRAARPRPPVLLRRTLAA